MSLLKLGSVEFLGATRFVSRARLISGRMGDWDHGTRQSLLRWVALDGGGRS